MSKPEAKSGASSKDKEQTKAGATTTLFPIPEEPIDVKKQKLRPKINVEVAVNAKEEAIVETLTPPTTKPTSLFGHPTPA